MYKHMPSSDLVQPLPPEEQRALQINEFYRQMTDAGIAYMHGFLFPEDVEDLGSSEGFSFIFAEPTEEYIAGGSKPKRFHRMAVCLQRTDDPSEHVLAIKDYAFIPTERNWLSRQEAVGKFSSAGSSEYTIKKIVTNHAVGPYFEFPALSETDILAITRKALDIIKYFRQLPEETQDAIRNDAYQKFTVDVVNSAIYPITIKEGFGTTVAYMAKILSEV